jgi:hypothetical protein
MAYINQNEKKELAVGIKAVLKKYGVKGSIAIRNHMVLVVNIKSGKLDIIQNWFDTVTKKGTVNGYGDIMDKPEYIQVNEYWINYNYSDTVKDFLNELLDAMKGDKYFNHDDIQSDYFHRSHYTDINIGNWNKPYEYTP